MDLLTPDEVMPRIVAADRKPPLSPTVTNALIAAKLNRAGFAGGCLV
jgi:hypothetical protein